MGHEGADGFDATGGIEVHGHSVQGACRRMGRSSMMTAAGKPFKTWIPELGRPPLLLHYHFSAPCASARGARMLSMARGTRTQFGCRACLFGPVRFGALRRMLRWRAAIPLRSIPLTTPKGGTPTHREVFEVRDGADTCARIERSNTCSERRYRGRPGSSRNMFARPPQKGR